MGEWSENDRMKVACRWSRAWYSESVVFLRSRMRDWPVPCTAVFRKMRASGTVYRPLVPDDVRMRKERRRRGMSRREWDPRHQ